MSELQNPPTRISTIRTVFNAICALTYVILLLLLVWVCGEFFYYKFSLYQIPLSPVTIVLLCILSYAYGFLYAKGKYKPPLEDS